MTRILSPDEGALAEPIAVGRLEQLGPELATLRRNVFSGREVIQFEFGKAPFRFRFVPETTAFAARIGCALRIGTSRGWLLIESFDVVGEEWATVFERLEPALARALLIEEVTQQFESLARVSGEPVQLVDLQINPTFNNDAPTQALRLENKGSQVGVRAALRAESTGFLERIARAIALRRPHIGARSQVGTLPVRLSPGAGCLLPTEIETLKIGDIVILQGSGTLAALQTRCLDFRGKRLPICVLLEGRSGRLMDDEGDVMSSERSDMKANEIGAAKLETLVVPITAVIGEVELPLRVFNSVGAGYVFELQTTLEQSTVRLYTGSRYVGSGRLVTIGERLGVRLLEWGGASDEHAA